jgi:hypothetical protein
MNKGLRGLMCLVLLLGVLNSGLPRPMAAALGAPVESGVYEEDFSSYAAKDYTENTEWGIWTENLHLDLIDSGNQGDPAIIALGDGTLVIAWVDNRNGHCDIYAQRIDADGNRLWSQEARINSDMGSTAQWEPALAPAEGNAVFVVWEDGRNGHYDIYAQQLDGNGNLLWSQDVRVNTDMGTSGQWSPAISPDGSGGAIIVWGDERNGDSDIYAQRLDKNGNHLWSQGVRINSDTGSTAQRLPALALTEDNSVFVVWEDGRNGHYDIYAQRLDGNGNRLWGQDIRVNSDIGTSGQSNPAISPDGSSGAIVVWNDERERERYGESDIYAQRLGQNGNKLWTADMRVNSDNSTAWYGGAALILDGANGVIVIWMDDYSYQVYAQRLNGIGNRVWTQDIQLGDAGYRPAVATVSGEDIIAVWTWDGVILAQRLDRIGNLLWIRERQLIPGTGAARQYHPSVVANDSGEAVLLWVDNRSEPPNNSPAVYSQRFDQNGDTIWPHDIKLVSEVGTYNFDAELDADGIGSNVVGVWGHVQAQQIDVSGNLGWPSVISVDSEAGFISPHSPEVAMLSDGSTIIVWQDHRNWSGSSQPFDVYAQRVGKAGERLWIQDVRVNNVVNSGNQYINTIDVAANHADAVTVVWPDYRQNVTQTIMAQRIGTDGVLLWGNGQRVNKQSHRWSWNPAVAIDSSGRSYVTWMADSQSPYVTLQVLDAGGNAMWGADVSVASSGCSPRVTVDVQDNAIVVWVSNGDVYAQRFDSNGNRLWADDLLVTDTDVNCSIGVAYLDIDSDHLGYFFVAWADARNGTYDVFLKKFNLSGQPQWSSEKRAVASDFFYAISGIAQSRTVDTLAADITQATLTADTTLNGGNVQFSLTNNGGATWATVTPGVTHVFTTTGSDMRWRAELTADPVWRHRSPVVNSLRIEYSSGSTGGDDYEPDDTCAQAHSIQINGAAQQHTFHQEQDSDWVWFDGQAGVTYIIQTSNTGPRADTVLELYDACDDPPIDEEDNAFGPGASLTFTAPATRRYYIRVLQHDLNIYGADTDYDLSVRAQQPTGAAIIVAGRLKLNDDVQPIIEATADWAYQALLQGGFAPENILYLSTATGKPEIDDTPTKANVRDAIQGWARTRVGLGAPLWLYLADHGKVDRFHNEIGEVVTAGELNLWLSNLEATSGVDQINVIVDACFCGSFIDTYQRGDWGLAEITGHGRMVVASTTSRWWAYSPRPVPGQPVPLMYFSDGFWRALGQGQSMWDAFLAGRATVEASGQRCGDYDYVCQRPWLDDTGDAWFDASDGLVAQTRGLAASFGGGIAPYIDWLTVGEVSAGQAVVRAQVRDDGSVERVWARVFAPSFTPPESADGTIPVIEVPEVELTRESGDVFSVAYPDFTEPGVYQVVLYAQDDDGYTSIPCWVLVGERKVYLPLVLRSG